MNKRKRVPFEMKETQQTKKQRAEGEKKTSYKGEKSKKVKDREKGKKAAAEVDKKKAKKGASRKSSEDTVAGGGATQKGQPKKQRCSFPALWKFFKFVRARIPDESWALIANTCFGPFISVFKENVTKEKEYTRQSEDFEFIMHFYKRKGLFNFNGTELQMKESDLAHMFSLPNSGEDFPPEDDDIDQLPKPQRQNVFELAKTDKGGPSRPQILDRLLAELNKGEAQDVGVIASLVIMHVFSSIFFPTTSTNITWDHVLACLNLDSINSYNWAKSVWESLLAGLKSYDRKVYKYIGGCTIFVQYWFIQHTNFRQQILDLRRMNYPLFCRIDTTCMFDRSAVEKNPNIVAVRNESHCAFSS